MNRPSVCVCLSYQRKYSWVGLRSCWIRIRAWVPTVQGTSLYIRPFMFATDEYIGVRPFNTLIGLSSLPARQVDTIVSQLGSRLKSITAGHSLEVRVQLKQRVTMQQVFIQRKLAQQEGYHQLIWTDGLTHQFVEEAGTMNIMFVIGDTDCYLQGRRDCVRWYYQKKCIATGPRMGI